MTVRKDLSLEDFDLLLDDTEEVVEVEIEASPRVIALCLFFFFMDDVHKIIGSCLVYRSSTSTCLRSIHRVLD